MRSLGYAAGIGATGLLIAGGWMLYSMPAPAADTSAFVPLGGTAPQAAPARDIPAGWKEYRSGRHGFSLLHPQDLSVTEKMETATSYTILFEDAAGEKSFQIYLAPIEGDRVTPERFALDAPSGVMQEPRNIYVDGKQAVTFYGFDETVGKTSEVWFIYGGKLYEVATVKELGTWLLEILTTWRFVFPK